MALTYRRPGVEITQVQESTSPTLLAEDLKAVVIGEGYYVVDIDDYTYTTTYSGIQTDVTIQVPDTNLISGTIDSDSIFIDLIQKTGAQAGQTVHLYDSTDHWTWIAPDTVRIAADLDNGSVLTAASGFNNADISIGYRLLRTDLSDFLTFESISDIETQVGDVDLLNPLGFAAFVALTNAQAQVHGMAVGDATSTVDHASALDTLALQEVYAMVPLDQNGTIGDQYTTHANAFSAATEKKERIVVMNRTINWADGNDDATTFAASDNAGTSRRLRANALARADSRTIWVHPDTCYVLVTAHLTTLRQDYIATNLFADVTARGLFAKTASSIRLQDGTTILARTDITDNNWDRLAEDFAGELTAYVPVPAYYAAAAVAGQISGEAPEQGLTNLAMAGISFLRYSSDYFTETQLNNIAQGGNYILQQGSDAAPISSRHQLTTDMSTIELREVNIRKSLDFVAKFLRNALTPYIGRYNITAAFLKLATSVCNGAGLFLKREGVINDFKVTTIEQDTVNPDTVRVEFRVLVKYPVNYITVDLVF